MLQIDMETLKYKIIKTEEQYWQYCNILEALVGEKRGTKDEIELLTVLIEKWDEDPYTDPVELLIPYG